MGETKASSDGFDNKTPVSVRAFRKEKLLESGVQGKGRTMRRNRWECNQDRAEYEKRSKNFWTKVV